MAPKTTKKAKGGAVVTPKGKAKKAPPPSESSEEEGEEMEVQSVKKGKKQVKNGTKKGGGDSAKKVKKVPAPVDSDDDDEEDSDDDTPALKNGKPQAMDEDDDEDDSDDSADEAVSAQMAAAAEDDESDEDESEEEEEVTAKPQKGKAAKKAKAEEESDEDDDEDEDEEDEEGESDEEEEAADGKRKKSQKEKSSKKAKVEEVVTVFIGNLDSEIPDKKVEKFFNKHGIKFSEVRRREGKKFGHFDLEDPEDMTKMLALNGTIFNDQALKIDRTRTKQAGAIDFSEEKKRTLFVKNLAESVTEDSLRELFDDVETVRMPKSDGVHKGYAYVVFTSEDTSNSNLEDKQGTELEGQALFIDRPRADARDARKPQSGGAQGSSKSLFVKNLPFSIDGDTLRDHFNGASGRIITHKDTGNPRGFGYVDFDTTEEAAAAYEKMKDSEIEGRQIFVDFANSRDNQSPRGGGGGGNRSFGGGGGGGSRACFKCGEEGHMSRECPQGGGGGGGGGSRACYNCGEEGHMSRECPSGGGGGRGRRGGGGRGGSGGFRGGGGRGGSGGFRGGRGRGGGGGGGARGSHSKF